MPSGRAIRAGRAFVELFADNSKLVRGLRAARAKIRAFGQRLQNIGTRIAATTAAMTADMVVVLGCVRGMIPGAIPGSLTPPEQQRFMEEQRRLFFVAITRSHNILILSNFASMPRDMAHRMRVPVRGGNATHAQTHASAFLGELGPSRPEMLTTKPFLESMGIKL